MEHRTTVDRSSAGDRGRKVFTVSDINRYIGMVMGDDPTLRNLDVKGEISNLKYHTSGHIYFSLKDRGSTIRCVMFAGNRRGLNFQLQDGMSVIVRGYIGVYEAGGQYQLYASAIVREGIGALYERYEALKKQLSMEGLFDVAHKKPIPAYPKTVGIVTAATGAAIRDIINVSTRRNPYVQLVFCGARVQGEGSARSVVSAIRALEAYGVDVMIVGRGGGSIEDLWAFNEEVLARAVYACSVPIISAVGHETDTTIIDFVSDLRAPTPSAAAELAVPDIRQILGALEEAGVRLNESMRRSLADKRRMNEHYSRLLSHLSPADQINQKRLQVQEKQIRLQLLMDQRVKNARSDLALYAGKLDGLSPLKQLERGYAYVTDEADHGVTTTDQVEEGDLLKISVTDGQIRARVQEIVRKDG